MKFFTNSAKLCGPRIGTLTEFERIPDISFETPLVLICTKTGSVPHLTKDIFKKVTSNQQLLSVSVSSIIAMLETLKDLDITFADFVCMKEHINFLSIHDPADATLSGFQQLDSISVWSRTGRHTLTANMYMDMVEICKPDFYVALCDGDTNIDSSKKRTSKAVSRSKTLLEQCLVRHYASESLKSRGILGAIEGGYDLEARIYSINYLKDKPLLGYVIDGLHNNGPDVRNISTEHIKEVVEHSINLLPAEKLKVSMGCWSPVIVLELIELGVDVFDTSYPYIATENSEALIFLCDHEECNNVAHVMLIEEKRYADDFTPICQKCSCLTCQNHTRAYLQHLHQTKELLGLVLLMIHNLHQYLQFFDDIRKNIKKGTFSEYRKTISSKFTKSDS